MCTAKLRPAFQNVRNVGIEEEKMHGRLAPDRRVAHFSGEEFQMGIFKWRGRISKQEFRKQLVEALRVDAPQLTYTPSHGRRTGIHDFGPG